MPILTTCLAKEKIQKEEQSQRSLGNSARLKECDAHITLFQIQAERSQDYIAFRVINTHISHIQFNSLFVPC